MSIKLTAVEILKNAKQVVETGWVQKYFCVSKEGYPVSLRDASASCHCSIGAISSVLGVDPGILVARLAYMKAGYLSHDLATPVEEVEKAQMKLATAMKAGYVDAGRGQLSPETRPASIIVAVNDQAGMTKERIVAFFDDAIKLCEEEGK